jgi:hypothetical protein
MPKAAKEEARERRLMRDRGNQIQRAAASVDLALDGLKYHEQLVVLNEQLESRLSRHDSQGPSNIYIVRQARS